MNKDDQEQKDNIDKQDEVIDVPCEESGKEKQSCESGALNDVAGKAKKAASAASEKIAQGARFARTKFEEAGGTEAVKEKTLSIYGTIKANFKPSQGVKGLNGPITRVINLWNSGWTGQITVLAGLLLVIWIISLFR